jgi:hypothetical protein
MEFQPPPLFFELSCKFHSTSNTYSEKGRTPIPIPSEHFLGFIGIGVRIEMEYLLSDSPPGLG